MVVAVAAAVDEGEEEEEEERRARLVERVVGPEEEDEGAAEEASARLRLRVSIQNQTHPSVCGLARHRAVIHTLNRSNNPSHLQRLSRKIPKFETLEIRDCYPKESNLLC